jgi:hypothetical protein
VNIFTMEIDPKEILLLETNARYMKHEEFNRLVENVRRDGKLTSAPFLCLEHDGPHAGKYRCLSGNHRTQAAIAVGLPKITCLATDDPLTEQERVAIQLSHNAISGQDDPATLKALYEQIIDTELKKYSGLDDKTLDLLDKVSIMSISEANLSFQTLSMVFLPDELEAAQKVIGEALERVKKDDAVWLARMSQYEDWMDAQELTASSHNVKNVATAVDLILQQFKRNMAQLSEGWIEDESSRWVPIESVIGRGKIPAGSARIIRRALDKMAGAKEINARNLWEGLEKMASRYLAERK